jgi:hypothetical protein
MLAFFHLPEAKDAVTLDTFLNVQTLADHLARVIPPVRQRAASRDEWILSESLRRTIFTACIFDDAWNALSGMPVYVAEELGRLPAPGSRALWTAADDAWGREWEAYVRTWTSPRLNLPAVGAEEPGLRLEELWGRGELSEETREARSDQWVMELDEFGGWVLAICEMGGSGRSKSVTV